MSKVTFTTTPAVYIEIHGEKTTTYLPSGGIARTYQDDGLIGKLLTFLADQEINLFLPNVQYTDNGTFHELFAPEDAAKIEAWLLEQGAAPE